MKWEYKVIDKYLHQLEEEINKLAEDGWEPICMQNAGGWGSKSAVILRRRKK